MATTRKKFEKALKSIGWNVPKSHNGLNDWLKSPDKTNTGFRVLDERIELRFENFHGGVNFYFEDCSIEYNDEKDCFHLMADSDNGSVFASFNNFK